jgi:osmotically-inducible protein OsmY
MSNTTTRFCQITLPPQEKIMSEDKNLKQAVLNELDWEPSVDSAHIGVTAHAGVVTLTGHVLSYAEKRAAEKAAKRVKDVKAVAEELEVRLPFNVKNGDEEIALAAIERLKWDTTVPSDAVKVTVEKGFVTLTGEVGWNYQREAAADDVRRLWGVTGVSDLITIKPTPNASNIKDSIITALHRSWFDPATIKVTAVGGKVHLTGTVETWDERDLAGTTAWAAPGATSVENDIRVD